MLTKQCVFKDEEGIAFGGIYVEVGGEVYIICGCCGGVMELTDITDLKLFDDWVNIEEEIRGDYCSHLPQRGPFGRDNY